MSLVGPDTQTIELKGRRVLPGLIHNHTHIIRGGVNFNMELRWDGVRSLADAMAMLGCRDTTASVGACRRRFFRNTIRRQTPAYH